MTINFASKRVVSMLFVSMGMVISFTSFPLTALAQSNVTEYQPRTSLEFISYLQGVVDTLQAQANANNNTAVRTSSLVDTLAADVEAEVELHSSFEIGNHSYVYAWFEYGENNTLNKATTKTRINDGRDDEVKHTRVISNIKSNTVYSYRAVYETSRGVKHYGQIKTFQLGNVTTTISNPTSGTKATTGKGSLATDAISYVYGEGALVDWTVTDSRNDTGNWIGMYKIGSDNKEYESYEYITGKSGTASFKIKEKGTFEFRLFLDNSYRDVVTSRRITVK